MQTLELPGTQQYTVYDRHLQENVGQCGDGEDEPKGLALQSSSPSQKVWQGGCTVGAL